MPQTKVNSQLPPVMTWGKAAPVLTTAAIFYVLRLIFENFWLFGPALAAAYCTVKASAYVGTTIGGLACTAAGGLVGVVGAAPIMMFGMVMAMAVAFTGWLTVLFVILITNARIFREDHTAILWLSGGLMASMIPFVGELPDILGAVWKVYHAQIKRDAKKLASAKRQVAAAQLQQRQQAAALVASQQAEETQALAEEEDMAALEDQALAAPAPEPRALTPMPTGRVPLRPKNTESNAQIYRQAA